MISLQKAHLHSTIDYYPFGMELPGRVSNASAYRFGMNGQMKDNEFTGQDGSHTTAMFWEYDSRIGRRWNLDPKPIVGVSDYVCFGNSPVFFVDVSGDKIDPSDLKNKDNKTYEGLKADFTTQTGLTLIENDKGLLDYKRDDKGKAIVAKDKNGKEIGSATARRLLKRAINKRETANLKLGENGTYVDENNIYLDPSQAEELQKNIQNGMNSNSVSLTMMTYHEIFHWTTGQSDPYNANQRRIVPGKGPAVRCESKIQGELGFDSRTAYKFYIGDYKYIPYDNISKKDLMQMSKNGTPLSQPINMQGKYTFTYNPRTLRWKY